MNTIIEKSEVMALDIAVLKCHLRLKNNLEEEYLSRIIDMTAEAFENKTGSSILKKKYRYVYNDYSSKLCLPMQPVVEVCSDKNAKVELPVEIEYIAGVCDYSEKVPKYIPLFITATSNRVFHSVLMKPNIKQSLSLSNLQGAAWSALKS
ncbi:hypothetical protein FACS1894113_4040 [Alphaproteobacteria bacterium]|nr:hypothetical protein FACS1894113_4040 [Alphaproteobacteria bacterium]